MSNTAITAPKRSTSQTPSNSRRVPAIVVVPLAAVAWWVVGYLPWIASGMRDSSVVGSAAGGPSANAGVIMLPLTSLSIGGLVHGALVGGVVAGLVGLMTGPGRRAAGTIASAGGVLLGLAVALVQSSNRVGSGDASAFAADSRVITGLGALTVLVALGGWAVGATAMLGRPGLGVALGVLSACVAIWGFELLEAQASPPDLGMHELWRWAGFGVLGAALVVTGSRPYARLGWWPLVLLSAWITGPALTAAGYLEQLLGPGRGLDSGRVVDAIGAAFDVFVAAASPVNRELLPWIVATIVGFAVAEARHRRSTERPADGSVQVEDSALRS